MADSGRERDLVLSPNEYAFIGDQTKGNINVYVGPYKTSLANTDQPMVFHERSKRFIRTSLEDAIQVFAIAPEGWYCMLKNPAGNGEHPKSGTVSSLPPLDIGRKVNLPGPIAFPLWPGQMSRIIQGHLLKSNQYLIVRVYDEQAARENWRKAVIKPQRTGDETEPAEPVVPELGPDLTLGKLLIIRGTEVSFYIPPTGIEVVRDDGGNYIRDAVTLERLEYCILLDETGRKRFVRGAAVVFPEPTERFVEKSGRRKFKAIELNEISGLYIKVIENYSEDGKEFRTGDELFITGRDQMIYFPRPEHAIIKYGDQEIHYAVAVPAGEGRYVLDRISGQIELVRGPAMFLPDPRRQVIVRRLLEPEQVEAWFPGDRAAREYYASLRRLAGTEGEGFLMAEAAPRGVAAKMEALDDEIVDAFVGDDFNRSQTFTKPRTITLDTKYEGAVSIDVPTGYAVLVVSKTGTRRVVTGPTTCLLEYDENLEALHLSTGTPKTDKTLLRTAYMRVLHNKVSDIIQSETKDLCRVSLQLSYRVNFEGEAERWFQVENYVRFLCDHMRSLLRKAIKGIGIEEFYPDAIGFVRDTILGPAGEDGRRPGRLFEENGMRVYDVEVLDVTIGDEEIARLLVEAQHTIVEKTLSLTAQRRHLEYVQQNEAIRRKIQSEESTTRQEAVRLQTTEVESQLAFSLAKVEAEARSKRAALEARLTDQTVLDGIHEAELARQKAVSDQELAVAKERLLQRIDEIRAEVQAVVDKAEAVSPDLIAALQAFGDKALAERMAETMAPLAILGGKSVADVMAQLLAGTALEGVIREKFLPGLQVETGKK